ncbi:DgyrCDS12891 [Dimorphilus gyrociliatus]|nr:DgyrCDS12891 [Dimorphilus gyrociliatus]
MFCLPAVLWKLLHRRCGLNVCSLIEASRAAQRALYADTREKTTRFVVAQIDCYLLQQRDYSRSGFAKLRATFARYCCLFPARLHGNYLTTVYLCSKFAYLINSTGQLFLLDFFLGGGYSVYGLRLLRNAMKGGRRWSASPIFPRVTLCDFQVRQQTNVHRYTVQCVLPINLFNEKIFIFIWFWLVMVSCCTLISLLQCTYKASYWPAQVRDVRKTLSSLEFGKREIRTAKTFVERYLRRDGMLLLRLITVNAGHLVSADVLRGLWVGYGSDKRIQNKSRANLSQEMV